MFGSAFRAFDDDPFFSDIRESHRRHMEGMQSMFSHDPFMSSMMLPGPVGTSRTAQTGGRRYNTHDPMTMSPFGMMPSMFTSMNSMMSNMHRNMEMIANDPNSHSYSQSTVMSYSNTGGGAPQIYQSSSTTRQAPGGVRETRKTVRDSHRGIEKMAIGHHIGERAHVIEKSRNTRTGDMEEKQDFLNIDETDAQTFDQEWQHRTGSYNRGGSRSVGQGRSRPPMAAITDGREYRSERQQQHDRQQRSNRHHEDTDRSVRFDREERSSHDSHPYQRRPTPARPKGPSKGGRQRDTDE